MIIVFQLIFSFLASAGFGILFNAPRRALVNCGLTGAAGWILYYFLREGGTDLILAAYTGAIGLTVMAIFFSRWMKMPIIIFITCGIIPLVPGGTAYDTMRHVVMKEYTLAQVYAFEVMLTAGAIALGIISAEMAYQVYQTIRGKVKRNEV
ncbi:threonine/serine exporter family protein [Salinicoccus albus]|uniref:threonine/serine exporter family protein n=1 Tax=Salinicoccus albus TaxID=418756 RepID=UPI0003777723|nr:threonine/serine exporter family protein [Salinicoccus albus]